MATLSVKNPTLLDLATRSDPEGKIQSIGEILNETNEIIEDVTFTEGNLPTGHQTTVRTGIPAPTWRKLYGGVQPNKSTTAKITDTCGMLEAYAEIDKALADLNGNTSEFRLSEDTAFIEGMGQEFANTLFFGDESVDPEKFTGLAPRFNSLSAENADNIVVGGGAGTDNTSIWLVGWSPQTVFGIIPKGSKAGLQTTDKGQVTIENADGANGRMEAYRTHYRWDCGLTVKDWRYVVRIPNIDKSLLTVDHSTGANLVDLMVQAEELIPNMSLVRPVWYMSRPTRTMLRRQITNDISGSTLTREDVGGKKVSMFNDLPVKISDVLAADEALVS